MNYLSAFEVSAAGMGIEKMRLDATALNLANANVSNANGTVFRPLRVIGNVAPTANFATVLGSIQANAGYVSHAVVEESQVEPRFVYEPGHPHANERGYVAYPAISQVSEMMNLMTALRSYEANVVAMNATKVMALRALDIGNNP